MGTPMMEGGYGVSYGDVVDRDEVVVVLHHAHCESYQVEHKKGGVGRGEGHDQNGVDHGQDGAGHDDDLAHNGVDRDADHGGSYVNHVVHDVGCGDPGLVHGGHEAGHGDHWHQTIEAGRLTGSYNFQAIFS